MLKPKLTTNYKLTKQVGKTLLTLLFVVITISKITEEFCIIQVIC